MSEGYHIQDEIQQRSYDTHLMRRLLAYVRPYRGLLAIATLLLLVASVLSNVGPYINMKAIDRFINRSERVAIQAQVEAGDTSAQTAAQLEAARAHDREGLLKLVVLVAALMLGEAIIRYGQTVAVAYVGQKTMLEMRMGVFRHLQRMSLRFLDRNPVGRLMTRVTNDVEKIQETIVGELVQVISDLFTILVVLAFMVRLNWALTLVITAATAPLVFASSWIFRKYAHRSYLEIRLRIARLNAHLQESLNGIRVLQAFGGEARRIGEYDTLNAAHRDEWLRQVKQFAVYFPVVDFFGRLAIALIFLYGGHQFLSATAHATTVGAATSGTTASIGMFFAYVQWTERLFQPIRALADRYNMLLEAMASSERIFKLLDTPEDVADPPVAIAAPEHGLGAVEFRHVSFSYGEATQTVGEPRWVLKDINLRIAPGERVAVVGHTGAGKTTLINLLSRFYDVQRGAILVDGVDVRAYAQAQLRRGIGVVLQDVFLFSGSIEHNIRLGDTAMTMEHVRACAAHVNAAPFIEALPAGYAYDVGERGCNLSTGQRQLLAFARALAHNPRILVLDEATSSVDTATEALIQDAVLKLMEGRTCIVVAHRLSTVQHADRIVVMHHGEVREEGTHQALLARRGLYHTLYRLQYQGQEGPA